MLRPERLFNYRQRALLEWSRCRKVAPFLERERKVVEACRRAGIVGAERLFFYCQGIAEKLRGLGIGRTPEEITACPVQKVGPVCDFRSGMGMDIAQRQQMRCKLGTQCP